MQYLKLLARHVILLWLYTDYEQRGLKRQEGGDVRWVPDRRRKQLQPHGHAASPDALHTVLYLSRALRPRAAP